jgi:hypothetical protein
MRLVLSTEHGAFVCAAAFFDELWRKARELLGVQFLVYLALVWHA